MWIGYWLLVILPWNAVLYLLRCGQYIFVGKLISRSPVVNIYIMKAVLSFICIYCTHNDMHAVKIEVQVYSCMLQNINCQIPFSL
jgi:hypothetical protein